MNLNLIDVRFCFPVQRVVVSYVSNRLCWLYLLLMNFILLAFCIFCQFLSIFTTFYRRIWILLLFYILFNFGLSFMVILHFFGMSGLSTSHGWFVMRLHSLI
jgi:hypothetical protein